MLAIAPAPRSTVYRYLDDRLEVIDYTCVPKNDDEALAYFNFIDRNYRYTILKYLQRSTGYDIDRDWVLIPYEYTDGEVTRLGG